MNLKKALSLFAVLSLLAVIIVACSGEATPEATEEAVATEEATVEATEAPMEATEEATEAPMEATEEAAMGAIESVCLVTDLGRVNDGTFNQYAHEGAVQATTDFSLDYTFIETEAETDYSTNIQTCVDNGADIVVTVGFLIQDATNAAAEANPGVYFIGVDNFVADGPSNFVGIQFNEDQAGFLVGAMAALVANANEQSTIAGVYGIDVPAVKRFRNGYEQGALFINPEWEIGTNILGVYADSFVDQAQGISLANTFIGEGAYVLFGAGGPLGSAAIAQAASEGVYVIGVDQDEYFTTFQNADGTHPEDAQYLISSALKRVDQGVYDMVAALAEGNMDAFPGGQNYFGSVGFAPAHDASIAEDIYTRVEEIRQQILSGEVSTNVDPVSGDVMESGS